MTESCAPAKAPVFKQENPTEIFRYSEPNHPITLNDTKPEMFKLVTGALMIVHHVVSMAPPN